MTSNTAMAAVFLPVAGATAIGMGEPAFVLTLPVALFATLGFMLPVATPPNAIIFATGRLRIIESRYEKLERENDELRDALKFQKTTAFDVVAAQIIRRHPTRSPRNSAESRVSSKGSTKKIPMASASGK